MIHINPDLSGLFSGDTPILGEDLPGPVGEDLFVSRTSVSSFMPLPDAGGSQEGGGINLLSLSSS